MEIPSSAYTDDRTRFLDRPDGTCIAYRTVAGIGPGVLFLSGFMSDMSGTKVRALEAHCQETGRAFTCLDYRGHGQSSGSMKDSGIGEWVADALAIFDAVADSQARTILVGSSMGGWIATRLLQLRGDRIAGFLGLAAAPDFDASMRASLSPEQRETIDRTGFCQLTTAYGPDAYVISRRLLEGAAEQHVLKGRIAFAGPVRLHHGLNDVEVPWQRSVELAKAIDAANVEVRLIGGGDHRLSDDAGLRRMITAFDELATLSL